MSYINNIGTAVPAYRYHQHEILEFMLSAGDYSPTEARKLRLMYQRSGIAARHSVLPDYKLGNNRELYSATDDLEPFPMVERRMQIFEENAPTLAQKAIENCIKVEDYQDVTHLITVSCTGLAAPGIDIMLVQNLGLLPTITRTSVNFMGCYAAFHALKIADAFCKGNADAVVLVVCVELCTLHFQKQKTIDYQTSNLLFADGAAACVVSNRPYGLGIKQFYSTLELSALEAMSWRISSYGFLMTLSSKIPTFLKHTINTMLDDAVFSQTQIQHWAVHPGGKSILEAIEIAKSLPKESLEASYDVLREYGNMSSATILFVLKRLMKRLKSNDKIAALAFGPGFTLESAVLTYEP